MKKIYLSLLLISTLSIAQTQIGLDIDGEAADDWSGWSVSLSSDGSIVAVGARGNDANGSNSGHVRVLQNVAGTWTQVGGDINGQAAGDTSGYSVSVSENGNIVAIGAPGNGAGYTRVYQNVSGNWAQIGSDIIGEAIYDDSGESVALSADGSIVAIGASYNTGNGNGAGHVRVYKNISGVWTQIGADINGEAAGDRSGLHVSISADGNTVAIGSPYSAANGEDSGQVRVFQNIAGVWTKIGANINGTADTNFGYGVRISGDGSIVAAGAPFSNESGNNTGHVRVYQNVSGTWTQIGTDIIGEAALDRSGYRLAMSADGSILAIGAYQNDGNGSNSGQVRIYKNVSGAWTQIGSDIDGEAANNHNGYSVSLSSSGSILATGAYLNNGNGASAGHVRVYDLAAVLASDSFVQSNFSVYPNPSNGIINISLDNNLQLEKVNVYNQLGQLIKTEVNSVLNITGLPYGTYYVEVHTNQGKATKKVMIQ